MLSEEFHVHVPSSRQDAFAGYVDGNQEMGNGSVRDMELRFRMAVFYVYMEV